MAIEKKASIEKFIFMLFSKLYRVSLAYESNILKKTTQSNFKVTFLT